MIKTIEASPTKRFFVSMLTRDIELRDAILDLLDNCVDGIVRSKGGRITGGTPYEGYSASITATPQRFVIEDNCGGIPRNVAEEVAFRLGRPKGLPPEHLETVGVYGIGMKRAIFKLGRRAVVRSEHSGRAFQVKIEPAWLDRDDWNLNLEEFPPRGHDGTTIEITELYDPIRREFTQKDSLFLDHLYGAIAENYSVIIGKGFKVSLNDKVVNRVEFNILMSKSKRGKAGAINPYVLKGKIREVDFELVVGFYRVPLTEEDIDSENESPRADLSQAGWSVICNDRLILRGDKSAVTGWGTANVPRFHNQFSSIAGIVTLRSTNPELLPLNTTKRGIETSSDVYFRLLDYMREGTKQFTDYTNKWKGRLEETKDQFADAEPVPADEVPDAVDTYKNVSNRKLAAEDGKADIFVPELPRPPVEESNLRKIVFSRPAEDISLVAKSLLDDENASPSQVGEACFEKALDAIPRPRKKKP